MKCREYQYTILPSGLGTDAAERQRKLEKALPHKQRHLRSLQVIRERLGREAVWLDVHKDLDVFPGESVLSPNNDPACGMWNHVTGQFRASEQVSQPPRHFQGMLPAEFSKEHYAEARRRVRACNRSIARVIQTEDDKALVRAIQAYLPNAPAIYTEVAAWRENLSEEIASAGSTGPIHGCTGDVVEVLLCTIGTSTAEEATATAE